MIEEILPDRVASAATMVDPPEARLYPEEAAVVRLAVPKRQREFATVRQCARRAMRQLGASPAPILPGPDGAPGWPEQLIGSMTHCAGYRAAAIARRSDFLAIGIDAEPNRSLSEGLLGLIAAPAERAQLAELTAAWPSVCWDRLLFSAKESAYKVQHSTGSSVRLTEARIEFHPEQGVFTTGCLVGRWLVRDGLILTAIAHPDLMDGEL